MVNSADYWIITFYAFPVAVLIAEILTSRGWRRALFSVLLVPVLALWAFGIYKTFWPGG